MAAQNILSKQQKKMHLKLSNTVGKALSNIVEIKMQQYEWN